MQFLISKNGTQIGPLTETEVRSKLATGEFAGSDLAWREGLAEWQPLSILLSAGAQRTLPRASASEGNDGTSGLAIGSLVCGLVGLGIVVTGLPAVILGHMSLSQIHKSGGSLRGRGMAIAGLVLGYLELVLIPLAIVAALLVPAFNVIQQKAHLVKAQNEARQIVVAAKTYASDHDGNYPAMLEELVKSGELADANLLECSLGKKYPGVKWVYQGAGLKSGAAPETVILTTSPSPKLKSRIVALDKGSVEIVRDTPPKNNDVKR